MRLESSIKNTVSSVFMQIVIMLIGLVLPRLYLTSFGSEINGLVSSITQFIGYFVLVEAGLSSATTNALYKPLAEGDPIAINRVLAATRKFYYEIGYIFTGLVFALAVIYPLFISTGSLNRIEIGILVIVIGLNGTIDFFTLAKYRTLVTANQKYYIVANATSIAYIVNFVFIFIVIKLSCSIIIVRVVALTMYILRSLILNIYVKRHYKFIKHNVEPDKHALNKRWDAMILQFLGLTQTSMPAIILTIFSKDLKVVSVYSIYYLVASSIINIMMIAPSSFAASFGEMIAKKEVESFRKAFSQYELSFFMGMTAVYSCVNIMYISFIRIYTADVTDINYILPTVALLFVINGISYNIYTPAGTLIGSAGVYKETKTGSIIQTIIAISLYFVLTPLYGIVGVLIALIVSNVYRDFDLIIFMSRNVNGVPYQKSLLRALGCCIAFAICNVPFWFFIGIEPNNFMFWCVQAFGVFIWCIVATICFFWLFEREQLKAIFSRGMLILNKRKRSV
ncbi:MAG TPA: hypothetical protein VHT96_11880 [Clostridia bacterium]|nr:hypothetical protein [Clostridia bacterium]